VTLSFEYTPDDYHEAVTGAPPRRGLVAASGPVVGFFLTLALGFMLFVLLRHGDPVAPPEAPPEAPLPEKGLGLRVLYAAGPSALLAAFFAFAVTRPMLKGPAKPWEKSQPPGGVKPPGTPPRGMVLLALFGVLVGILFLWLHQPSTARAAGPAPPAAGSTLRFSDADLLIPLIPWAFIVAVALLAGTVQQRRGLYKLWEVQPPLRRPHRADFSDYGVIVSDAFVRTASQWQAFEGFRETPNLFVLYTSPLAFLIVPKRAFADAAQLDAFRGLVLNRVGKSSFLPQPGGFPVLPVEAQPV
jgi:hypothetical protein